MTSSFVPMPMSYTSHDNGVNWLAPVLLPSPGPLSGDPEVGVSCDREGHCAAVHVYNNGSQFVPISYTSNNNGSSWIVSLTPPPALSTFGVNNLSLSRNDLSNKNTILTG